MKQTTFASAAWDKKGKVTRRERFLAEMDAVIPWKHLNGLISPYYPKAGKGTQPMPQERMLRIYFMQQWFNLSDPAMEDSLYDSESMRRFAGIELTEDAVPDETTILRFRHLLEKHCLTQAIFGQIRSLLEQKRLLLKSGTIVDATIIEAPPSTKNAEEARDPEMHQTKKGGEWHFGMKAPRGHRQARHHAQPCHHGGGPLGHRSDGQAAAWAGAGSLWRSGLLERVAPPGSLGARDPLPHQPPSQPRPAAEPPRAPSQPPAFGHPGPRRACLPCREVPVGLHQGALPRTGQEHRAALYRLRPGEPVPAAATVAQSTGNVCLVRAKRAQTTADNRPDRLIYCLLAPLS